MKSTKSSLLDTVNKLSYLLVGIIAFCALIVAIQYWQSPSHVKDPEVEHYHFRLQIVADGEVLDFSQPQYQEPYEAGQCTADLPTTPIHFHDKVNQLTHIHWDGIRGGDVLKYYGWNLIGGSDNSLGKRFDDKLWGESVPVHDQVLPEVNSNSNYYIYSGSKHDFESRNFDDFLNKDLEVFFDKQSLLKEDPTILSSLINMFTGKAHAHAGDHNPELADLELQELNRINNLIGNVVIFAQENEPTHQEVLERFFNLQPLQDSTCGG